jgi:hypothetical protein
MAKVIQCDVCRATEKEENTVNWISIEWIGRIRFQYHDMPIFPAMFCSVACLKSYVENIGR